MSNTKDEAAPKPQGMGTNEIQQIINAMPARMSAKGLREPDVKFNLSANSHPQVMLTWSAETSTSYVDRKYEWAGADTPREALDKAEAYISALPSAEETKRNNFLTALAKVVDLGRETGIEVDFVNPLVDTMKRISENAITYRQEAA